MRTRSNVLDHAPADVDAALGHFNQRLTFEADCADVYADLLNGVEGFTVLDTRSPERYQQAHIPGAVNVPHRRITAAALHELGVPEGDLLVTYCAGPHCNASTRGAIALAKINRPVKEMPGGMLGWLSEGFPVATGVDASDLASHMTAGT